MTKRRGRWLGLGLAALLALSAGETKAEVMTLSVIYGGQTFGFSGGSNAVTVNTTIINSDLAGSGYTFSDLGAISDWFGENTTVGAYIMDRATLTRGGGTGGPLTIVVSEGGFTLPVGGSSGLLTIAPTAIFVNAKANVSSQRDMGTYTPGGGGSAVSTPTATMASNGTPLDSHNTGATAGVPKYVTPYTLTLTQTISLTPRSGFQAATVIGGNVSIVSGALDPAGLTTSVVPEPAGLTMMAIGMALPLVVGVLHRRRAVA